MFIHYWFKNKKYLISKRDFLSDYSRVKSKKIDMTLSGKYLSSYGNLNLDINKIDKYPCIDDIELLESILKEKLNIRNEIIIGNGVNGLLQNIIKILYINRGNLVTPFYTFNQAEFGVSSFNGYTKRVYCNNYEIDLKKMRKSIDSRTKMIYICNPNNPTGIYLDSKKILEFVKKVKVPVIIDESGIEFTNKKSILDFNDFPSNLIVLRSFSKAYGIANLRIGFLVCSKKFKNIYLKKITTNEFSGISCNVATKILEYHNMSENVSNIVSERSNLEKKLKELGIDVIKSNSNILMTRTIFKNNFIYALNKNDISVVPIYDENNKLHIRIAIQDKNTNNLFIKKIKKIMKDDYVYRE